MTKKSAATQMLNGFKTDEKKEIEGEVFRLSNGAFAQIARWNNPEHAKVTNRLRRPYMAANGRMKSSMTDEKGNEIMVESMATTILLGWKAEEKDQLEYDVEVSKELLGNKDFLLEVFEISQDRANFLAEEKEKAAKN